MSQFSQIALYIALPSLIFDLLWIINFMIRRESFSQERKKHAGNHSSGYVSRNPDRRVRQAIEELLVGEPHAAVQLTNKAFKTKPERWPLLRQEIAQLPHTLAPAEMVKYRKEAIDAMKKTASNNRSKSINACSVLIWGVWYLGHAHQTIAMDRAETWYDMARAYENLANHLPEKGAALREAGLNCCLNALSSYRALNVVNQQITTLCLIGKISAQERSPDLEPNAHFQVARDYYIQAHALLRQASSVSLDLLSTIYAGIGDSCYALFQFQHEGQYLQEAVQAYKELLTLYQEREPQNTSAINNIKAKLALITDRTWP